MFQWMCAFSETWLKMHSFFSTINFYGMYFSAISFPMLLNFPLLDYSEVS
jgi:hypothetical protein